ncbi:MAG: type 4a pilus biogenesis protein PilO, partial [Bdellovibrionales bacterium]|nr:type 4a pilus biogenesis protein PilO [Bdellovibrionales bacterium]
ICWQYMYKPNYEEHEKLQESIEDLQVKITNEQRLARNLKTFREEVKVLDQTLNRALRELPDKREIPDLLKSISTLARDAGLKVSLFKTNPERIKDFYAEVPVEISLKGTFHQVASFFDEVGALERIVNIGGIELANPKIEPDQVEVAAKCVATTFRYLDDEERARQETAKTTSKKKRRR